MTNHHEQDATSEAVMAAIESRIEAGVPLTDHDKGQLTALERHVGHAAAVRAQTAREMSGRLSAKIEARQAKKGSKPKAGPANAAAWKKFSEGGI